MDNVSNVEKVGVGGASQPDGGVANRNDWLATPHRPYAPHVQMPPPLAPL